MVMKEEVSGPGAGGCGAGERISGIAGGQVMNLHFFQGPTIPNREYQCAYFEPLVDLIGKAPSTHS